ncbi:MAG: tetratricopeptide repeat protein [Saprospiraceae bacterium]
MKKQAQISKEDAKLLLQSHPLVSHLWLASSADIQELAVRLPDPSYSDSFNWPSYQSTKAMEVLNDKSQKARIDFVKEVIPEESVLEVALSSEQESKHPELEQETEVEIAAELDVVVEKENKNQVEVITAIQENELNVEQKKEEFIPEEFEEAVIKSNENPSIILNTDASDREPNLKTNLLQESAISKTGVKSDSKFKKRKGRKLVKSTEIDAELEDSSKIEQNDMEVFVVIPEVSKPEKQSKRISKNLDFYAWLEELNLETNPKHRKKAERSQKTLIKKDVLPVDETRKAVESSLKLGEEIVSETLAKLLARQGHKEEAIEMYQKLASKYPEKGTTFAAAIQKLKS